MIKIFLLPLALWMVLFGQVTGPLDTLVIDGDIRLLPIKDSIYVHETWHKSEGFGRFPSNGLIIIRGGQALMIDTPMDNQKTEKLYLYLKDSMNVKIDKMIAGHFHGDCVGGLAFLQSKGVESIANDMTVDFCRQLGKPVPSHPFSESYKFDFNGMQVECRYFGGGHTVDNIVVWLPQEKILFGGCLVRAANADQLGNLRDAAVGEWDKTISRILKAYPEIETVIPGHGAYGGVELLEHTTDLVKKHKLDQ
jgi:metallo-beta-lactamase class B